MSAFEKIPDFTNPDEELIGTLYHKYRKALVVEAYSILGNAVEAEDIVQDLFSSLWTKKKLDDVAPGNYRNYLYQAVRRNCMSHQRKQMVDRKRRARYTETSGTFDLAGAGENWEIRQRINEAVQGLPEQRRWAFIKAHIDKKSYREVGNEMGLRMETVRTHVKMALKSLRLMLANLK
ncbi:sigma-70 family RNA polymerase sigma factor [Chitinophaga lutea]